MQTHSLSSGGIIFHGWPDGGALFEQEELAVQTFGLIKDEILARAERENKRHTR